MSRYSDGGIPSAQLPRRPTGKLPPGAVCGPERAIVVATHYRDDRTTRTQRGVECDVLLYGNALRPLHRVPVRQSGGAGDVALWTPSPTTANLRTKTPITGTVEAVLDALQVADLEDLDGDHVIVEFFGGRPSDPVITGSIPHPRAARSPLSVATAIQASGAHPATPDAPVRFLRHRGSTVMLDRRGSVVIDTTDAPEGNAGVAAGGTEPAGRVYLQLTDRIEVRIGGTLLFAIRPDGTLELGVAPSLGVARETDPVKVDSGSLFSQLDTAGNSLIAAGTDGTLLLVAPVAAAAIVDAGAALKLALEGTGMITDASAKVLSE